MQEAFVRLMQQRHWPESVREWLFRVVRNQVFASRRKQRRRRRHQRRIAREAADWFTPRDDDLIDARAAQDALARLPADQRETVVLRIWAEMTFAQIGEIVGASASTVLERYRSALRALRKQLETPPCRIETH